MSMLEQMKKRAQERKTSFEKDNTIFAFWNLAFNNSTTVRFLPYNDPLTGFFFAERVMLPMAFADPEDSNKVVTFRAPCLEMYDRKSKCPVLGPVRALYGEEKELRNSGSVADADKLKKIAGYHWKKPTFYYQGFVVKAGFSEDETPENPIRIFPINKMLHQKIYDSIFENEEDPFEKLPTGEFTEEMVASLLEGEEVDVGKFEGHNFIIKKGKRGEYADWTTGSQWSSKMTMLEDEQIAAIAKYGFHDLTKRIPDRPSDDQYEVLAEMMQVSVDRMLHGENGVWQKEWEEHGFKPIRPRGNNNASSDGETKATTSSARKGKAADTAAKASGGTSDALAKLRAARGKADKDEDVADEAPAQEAEETPAEDEAPAESGGTNVQALADKIRSRVKSA